MLKLDKPTSMNPADPFATPAAVADPFAMETATSTHNTPRITFSALDISLSEALDIICELTSLCLRTKGGVVFIEPRPSRPGEMISRAVPQAPRGVVAKLARLQPSAVHALGFDPIVGAAFKDWCFEQGLGNEYRPFDAPINCEVFPETGAMIIRGRPADVAWVGSFLAHVANAESTAPNRYRLQRLTSTSKLELLLVDTIDGDAWRYQPPSRAGGALGKFVHITTTAVP